MYYHNKQVKEAELAWKQALELDPANVETRSNYVSTLNNFGADSNRIHAILQCMGESMSWTHILEIYDGSPAD